MENRYLRLSGLVIILLLTPLAKAAEEWIRLDNPTSAIKRQLTDVAISYPNFLWLEASNLPSPLAINRHQINHYTDPFSYRIDGQRLDLSQSPLPKTDWYRDDTLARGSEVSQLYIVQFKGPIKNVWLSQLKNNNIKPIKPLAPYSWIVWATPQQQQSVSQMTGVRISRYLYSTFRVMAQNRSLSADRVPSMALVVKEALAQSRAELVQLGAFIHSTVTINSKLSALNFSFPGSQYQAAASIPGLLTIQKVPTDGGPRGEMSQQSVVGAYDGGLNVTPGYKLWLKSAGVTGKGVTVGVVDGGIYNNHPDLVGQFLPCAGPGPSCGNTNNDHGTHVAAAIAGTGANNDLDSGGFNRGLGVAPDVKIVEQLYGPLTGGGPGDGGMVAGGMLSIYKDSQISGALLTNNSWGPSATPQGYDIPTMEIDMIARDANPDIPGNQPVMPVWSINNGYGDRPFGACAPSSLGAPDEAKNLFAVGSTKLQSASGSQLNKLFDISGNSGHGPACDGRLVPHIVAPGCYTESPDSANGYGLMCGTSMASPIVSGAVALYWQQHKKKYGIDPSSALIKALFTVKSDDLNGYDDADGNVLGHAPNRKQGWGRLNLDRIIHPPNSIWFKDQQITFTLSGEQWSVPLTADNPAQPVKIMLVWTDAPAAAVGTGNSAWVNDLDLSVQSQNNIYLGNQFAADGFAATGGSPDFKNNMEGVFLKASQHQGNPFRIQVMAANIMGDALNPYNPTTNRQDFALVCDNCVAILPPDLIFKNGFESDIIFKDGFE